MEVHFTKSEDEALEYALMIMRTIGEEGWNSSFNQKPNYVLIHASRKIGPRVLHRLIKITYPKQKRKGGKSDDHESATVSR